MSRFTTITGTASTLYAIDDEGTVWQLAHNAAMGQHWAEVPGARVPRAPANLLYSTNAPPGWPANVPYPPVAQQGVPPMGQPPAYPPQQGAPPGGNKASCHAPPMPPVVTSPLAPAAQAPHVPVDRNAGPAVPPPGGDPHKMGVAPPKQ